MPSFKQLFSIKKKKKHPPKFHEYNSYDSLRAQSVYPISTIQHQGHPPPHTLTHRQQQQQQQYGSITQHIIHSPHQPAVLVNGQCQCHQCSYLHGTQTHHHHQQHDLTQQQQSVMGTQVVNHPHINNYPQVQPSIQDQHIQQIHLNQQQPLHHQTYQTLDTSTNHNLIASHIAPTPQCTCHQCPLSQHQHLLHQQIQQQQHQQPLPVNQSLAQPLGQQQPNNQQYQMTMQHQGQAQQSLQQPLSNHNPHISVMQVSGTCQHQMSQPQIHQHQQHLSPQHQYHTYAPVISQTTLSPSQQVAQIAPIIIAPQSTSVIQQPAQQLNNQTMSQAQPQRFLCHTIQPQQHQQLKQMMQQRQETNHSHFQQEINQQHQCLDQSQHQRAQSLHQQTVHAYQSNSQPHRAIGYNDQVRKQSPVLQPRTLELEPLSDSHDTRYANLQPTLDDSLSSKKAAVEKDYQDHVYYNQKQADILPPYESPPDYKTFMEQKRLAQVVAMDFNGQHVTCHSESLVWSHHKAMDYENVARYGNVFSGRLESGYTS